YAALASIERERKRQLPDLDARFVGMRKRICDVLLVRNGEQREVQREIGRARAVRDSRERESVTEKDRERRLGTGLECGVPGVVEVHLETAISAHADEHTAFTQRRVIRRIDQLAVALGNDRQRDVEILTERRVVGRRLPKWESERGHALGQPVGVWRQALSLEQQRIVFLRDDEAIPPVLGPGVVERLPLRVRERAENVREQPVGRLV